MYCYVSYFNYDDDDVDDDDDAIGDDYIHDNHFDYDSDD